MPFVILILVEWIVRFYRFVTIFNPEFGSKFLSSNTSNIELLNADSHNLCQHIDFSLEPRELPFLDKAIVVRLVGPRLVNGVWRLPRIIYSPSTLQNRLSTSNSEWTINRIVGYCWLPLFLIMSDTILLLSFMYQCFTSICYSN